MLSLCVYTTSCVSSLVSSHAFSATGPTCFLVYLLINLGLNQSLMPLTLLYPGNHCGAFFKRNCGPKLLLMILRTSPIIENYFFFINSFRRNLVNILLYLADQCKRYYPPQEIPLMLETFLPLLTKEVCYVLLCLNLRFTSFNRRS